MVGLVPARIRGLDRLGEEGGDVRARERRRHQAEGTQGGKAAADVRGRLEHGPEPARAAEFGEGRPRIRDRDEVRPRLVHDLRRPRPEVAEEGERLDGGAGLARHDEERVGRAQPVEVVERPGVRGVDERERQPLARHRARDHLRREAGASHPEQHEVREPEGHARPHRLDRLQPRGGRFGEAEPTEPVGHFGGVRVRAPQRRIASPQSRDDILGGPGRQAAFHGLRVAAQRRFDLDHAPRRARPRSRPRRSGSPRPPGRGGAPASS